MRASRLLQLLLLLQNRGRMTARQLAAELEVAHRTILRDVDALTEAGLPVVVHRGARGGIELGFNYRTRLTGLSRDEAEALGLILGAPAPHLADLGLARAGQVARTKLLESLPDGVREVAAEAQRRFRLEVAEPTHDDARVPALAEAIRARRKVRLRARSASPRVTHPTGLVLGPEGWALIDARAPDTPIPSREWGDVNISALSFAEGT